MIAIAALLSGPLVILCLFLVHLISDLCPVVFVGLVEFMFVNDSLKDNIFLQKKRKIEHT